MNSAADYLWTSSATSALLGLQPAHPPCGSGLANLHYHVNQFLTITLFLLLSLSLPDPQCIFISSISLENPISDFNKAGLIQGRQMEGLLVMVSEA